MIEEWATVSRVAPGRAWLQADRRLGCQRCEAGQGCGGGLLGKLVGNRRIEIEVEHQIEGLAAGDAVVIGFPEATLLRGSLLAYGLPMLCLLVGAALGSWLIGGFVAAALGGVGGIAAGWLLARTLSAKMHIQPRILRRVGAEVRAQCWADPAS